MNYTVVTPSSALFRVGSPGVRRADYTYARDPLSPL